MRKNQLLEKIVEAYLNSPYPSFKVTNYFPIYVEIFGHLVDTECTFIETGVLNGGSLFMWRKWLGPKARIIGIDLNPAALKWKDHGFEIYVGDQGSTEFWSETFRKIGNFDAILDDGGHQSFQQIVTLSEAIRHAKDECVIAIEDTLTSHMSDFSEHGSRTFLEYAKDSTDILSARNSKLWPKQYPEIRNHDIMAHFSEIFSIQFYTGIVSYKLSPLMNLKPELIWNRKPEKPEQDYRHEGTNKFATVNWPDPFVNTWVEVHGK